jgi:cytidylate kinase
MISFVFNPERQASDTYLNGENIEAEIRKMYISDLVSQISAVPVVRHAMVALQQKMGQKKALVMDGRDIGTVVFPNAELKLFVTADPAIRLERRYQELLQTNPSIQKEEVAANLQQRDLMDSTRAHSPLKQAEDALVLDNTNLDRAQQFELAMQWAMDRIKAS